VIVYHGSYKDIGDDIDLSKSKVSRDFGSGFYVTNIFKQAEKWARQKGKDNKTDGCVTKWEFDENVFNDKDFNTLKFDDYSVEWVEFVKLNRKNNTNLLAHKYDIVEGPVADDYIYASIDKYEKKNMPIEELVEVLKTREQSHQICFCTMYSLAKIHREKNFDVEDNVWEIGKYILDNLAKKGIFAEKKNVDLYYASKTYEELTDESTKLYEKPAEEIYDMLLKELGMTKIYTTPRQTIKQETKLQEKSNDFGIEL